MAMKLIPTRPRRPHEMASLIKNPSSFSFVYLWVLLRCIYARAWDHDEEKRKKQRGLCALDSDDKASANGATDKDPSCACGKNVHFFSYTQNRWQMQQRTTTLSREGQFNSVAGKWLIYPTSAMDVHFTNGPLFKIPRLSSRSVWKKQTLLLPKSCFSLTDGTWMNRSNPWRWWKANTMRLIDTTLSTKSLTVLLWRSKICCSDSVHWTLKKGESSWLLTFYGLLRSFKKIRVKYTCLPHEDSSFVDLPQLLSMHIVGILCPQCIILSAQYEIEKRGAILLLMVKNKNSLCIRHGLLLLF